MNTQEAANILTGMYEAGRRTGRTALAVHLFGITYADELSHLSTREVVAASNAPLSYAVEVNKGRNLAEYVTVVKSFP